MNDSISEGKNDYVNKYIQAGGDINIAIDDKGTTMLMQAKKDGNNEIIDILTKVQSKEVVSVLKSAFTENNTSAKYLVDTKSKGMRR